jgi:hypothetical protein
MRGPLNLLKKFLEGAIQKVFNGGSETNFSISVIAWEITVIGE